MGDAEEQTLTGEVQEMTGSGWRSAHLGANTGVRDRRRVVLDREPTFGPPRPRPVQDARPREVSDGGGTVFTGLADHPIVLPPGAVLEISLPDLMPHRPAGEWVQAACGCVWRESRPAGLRVDQSEPRACVRHDASHPESVRSSPQGMAMVPVTYHHERPCTSEISAENQ